MTEPAFRYPLKDNTYRVIDGDTVSVLIDRGWGDWRKVSVRILGVDAPESRTRKNLLEREAGGMVTTSSRPGSQRRSRPPRHLSCSPRPRNGPSTSVG